MVTEIQEEAIQITVRAGTVTLSTLLRLMAALARQYKQVTHGKQSLRKLNLQNRELVSYDFMGADMQALRRELRRYNVDFAVMKGEEPGTYKVFFKAQDAQRIYTVVSNVVKNFDWEKEEPLSEKVKEAERQAEAQAREAGAREHKRERRSDEKGKTFRSRTYGGTLAGSRLPPEPLLGGSGGAASGQPHRAVAGCCGCYHTIHRSCSVVHWSIKSIPTGRGVRIWYGMAYVSVPSCGPEANVWD